MQIDFITLIILILALYGLVAIIRDIVVGVKNVRERRAIDKAFKEFSSKINLESARTTRAFYFGNGEGDSSCDGEDCGKGLPTMAFSSNSPKPKRKYNKSGKYKKVGFGHTPGYKAKTTTKKLK